MNLDGGAAAKSPVSVTIVGAIPADMTFARLRLQGAIQEGQDMADDHTSL